MSELIRRFETATRLASAAMEPLTKIVTMDAQAILNLLREQPEVILCRECVNFRMDNVPEEGCGYCNLLERTFYCTDYCSQAVKQDGQMG